MSNPIRWLKWQRWYFDGEMATEYFICSKCKEKNIIHYSYPMFDEFPPTICRLCFPERIDLSDYDDDDEEDD